MTYILTVLFSVIAIIIINILVEGIEHILSVAIMVVVSTIAVIIVDAIFATIIRWLLPRKLFSREKRFFIATKKESRFFEYLGIKKWKDKILELGCFTNFRKDKILEPNNNEYLERYIVEANYGIAVHFACMIGGFLIFLLYREQILRVGLLICIVNFVLNFMAYASLRYNLTKLHKIYQLNERKAKRNNVDKIC